MSKRWAAAVWAAVLLASGAARAERPRISVAPVAGEHATPELREHVGEALAEGLMASGAEVAPALGDATYMLRGRVEVEGRSYTLHLEMLNRQTGAVVASREDRCEICTEAEAFETANTAASTLKALVFKRQGAAGAAKPAQALAAPVPLAAPVAVAVAPGASAEVETTARAPARHRGLGWASLAGGIVSAGAGSFLLSIDGHGTCGRDSPACPDEYQTRWGGIGLVALGVVAVGAGVLALVGRL